MARKRSAPAPTLVLLVRHGQTPTTGTTLPGRARGLHLADSGIAQAEAQASARINHLLDELDDALLLIDDMLEMSAKSRHPSARSLSLVKDGA